MWREDDQTVALRGSKSRNKVSVGEPAEGSLTLLTIRDVNLCLGIAASFNEVLDDWVAHFRRTWLRVETAPGQDG